MAGKKSSGKNYTSKGERPNVTRSVLNALRREYIQSDMRRNNQAIAWRKGKNVCSLSQIPIKRILKSV